MKKILCYVAIALILLCVGCGKADKRTVSYVYPNGNTVALSKDDSTRYLEAFDNLTKEYIDSSGLGIGGYYTFKISEKGKEDILVCYADEPVIYINNDRYYADLYDRYFDLFRELMLSNEELYYKENHEMSCYVIVDAPGGITPVAWKESGNVMFVNGSKTIADVWSVYEISNDDSTTIDDYFENHGISKQLNAEVVDNGLKIKVFGVYDNYYYIVQLDTQK